MKMKLFGVISVQRACWRTLPRRREAGAEIIAIILIIVVVIGLAAFFRDGIKEVVTNLMERIKGEAGGFQS